MTTSDSPCTVKKGLVAGNFDVIHPGYVKLFEDAKSNACNYLIVALQGDPTIERPFKCKPGLPPSPPARSVIDVGNLGELRVPLGVTHSPMDGARPRPL